MKTSNVKNMNNLFANCSSLKTIPKFEFLKVINVTDISFMFFNCSKLKMPNSNFKFEFNKEKIIDMSYLFYNCKLLNSKTFSQFFKIKDYKKVDKIDKIEIFSSNSCIIL